MWHCGDMGDEVGRNRAWYYCLRHERVEPEDGCKAKDRLGPYASPEAAEQGLQSLHEREERLAEEDREWADGNAPG